MKKTVRIIACLILVAILCTSCASVNTITLSEFCAGLSIENTGYTPTTVKKITNDHGMSYSEHRNHIFVLKGSNSISDGEYWFYNAKTSTVVLKYDIDDIKDIDFFTVGDLVYIIVVHIKDDKTNETRLYTENGTLITDKNGKYTADNVVVNSELGLFTFDGVVYRTEKDGGFKVALNNPFVSGIPGFDTETDNYYYDKSEDGIAVYDKSFNLVYYKDIPYTYHIGTHILSGDYLLVQWMELLPLTEKKYDYIYSGQKMVIESLIIEVATGKEKSVDLNYVVSGVVYCSAYKGDVDVSYNIEGVANILEVTIYDDEKFVQTNDPTCLVSINSETGKVEKILLGEDSKYEIISPLANGYYTASTKDGGYYIIDAEGNAKKIDKTTYTSANKNNAFILNDGKLYNYKLQLVFDYEDADYKTATGVNGSPIMNDAIIFIDEDSKYHLYTASGVDKLIDGTVTYISKGFYVVKNLEQYTVYTSDGTRVGETIEAAVFSIVAEYDTGAIAYVVDGADGYYYNISK